MVGRFVLAAVLDVDAPWFVVKPGIEVYTSLEFLGRDRRATIKHQPFPDVSPLHLFDESLLYLAPVEFNIVVALGNGDVIAVRNEPAYRGEEVLMSLGNLLQFPLRFLGRRPQPIVPLVDTQFLPSFHPPDGPQQPSLLWQRDHLQEIEQVAVDDQQPRAATEAGLCLDLLVIAQEARKGTIEQEILQAGELATLRVKSLA